ncbi:MAG: alginate export family protein [Pseudomonadota bacterium]
MAALRSLLISASVCACLATAPAFAQSPPGRAPDARPSFPYSLLAFNEDWTFTRDPGRRAEDWSYRLKEIPLNRRADIRLSLGAELRATVNYLSDFDFGEDGEGDDTILLGRFLGHAELTVGDRFRLFGTLQASDEVGGDGPPIPIDTDRGDIQNFFAEYRLDLSDSIAATARIGRQEFQYGGGRLVTARAGPNVRRAFDAAKIIFTGDDWRADLFFSAPVEDDIGAFDDEVWREEETFWGVYAGHKGLAPHSTVEAYYLVREQDVAIFEQGAARSDRRTIGARITGAASGWDWDWEAAYQFGDFGDADIRAWTFATETGYVLEDVRFSPRLAIGTSLISGDDDPADMRLGSFDGLYPNGAYFSQAGLIGPRNLIHVQPQARFELTEKVGMILYGNAFWRFDEGDGVYAPSGRLIRESDGAEAREIGQSAAITLDWTPNQHTTFEFEYVHFFAGDFFSETGAAEDVDFIEFEVTYRF